MCMCVCVCWQLKRSQRHLSIDRADPSKLHKRGPSLFPFPVLPSGCGPKKSQPSTNDVYRPEHCLRRVPCGWVCDSARVSTRSLSGLYRVSLGSLSGLSFVWECSRCRFAAAHAAEGAADLARYRNASNDKWFKIYYRSQVALFPNTNGKKCIETYTLWITKWCGETIVIFRFLMVEL